MGRVLAEIFNNITGQECIGPDRFNNTRNAVPDNVSIPFWRLIVRMLSPDMFLRPSAAEVFAEYNALLPLIRQMYGYVTVSVAANVENNNDNNNTSWSFCDPGTWKCFRRARTLRKSKVI